MTDPWYEARDAIKHLTPLSRFRLEKVFGEASTLDQFLFSYLWLYIGLFLYITEHTLLELLST